MVYTCICGVTLKRDSKYYIARHNESKKHQKYVGIEMNEEELWLDKRPNKEIPLIEYLKQLISKYDRQVVEEPVIDPIIEPIVEPVEEPIEPVIEPVEDPVIEPVEEPIEPVIEPDDEPVIEPDDEPVIEPDDEPVIEEPEIVDEGPIIEPPGIYFYLFENRTAILEDTKVNDHVQVIHRLNDIVNYVYPLTYEDYISTKKNFIEAEKRSLQLYKDNICKYENTIAELKTKLTKMKPQTKITKDMLKTYLSAQGMRITNFEKTKLKELLKIINSTPEDEEKIIQRDFDYRLTDLKNQIESIEQSLVSAKQYFEETEYNLQFE